MRHIGPIKIVGSVLNDEVLIPLATFETPLWPSTQRGSNITRLATGIKVTLLDDRMTRSLLLEAPDAEYASNVLSALRSFREELEKVVSSTSRFAELKDWHTQVVGKLIYIRFAMSTGDAAGHNMTTKAVDELSHWILSRYPRLRYVSVSGNYCTDKKASAVNGILGRGKYVVAEMNIPRDICEQYLRTTPEKIVELNIKKNLIGSIIAGGVRSANAHFANMLLGFYLATGQDAANIIEGSQGIVYAELQQTEFTESTEPTEFTELQRAGRSNQQEAAGLYFSVTLPNLIIGAVGNGKQHDFVRKNLEQLGCLESNKPGTNGRRLAAIAAAAVFCGELSLLAAQTNPGELMKSHLRLERLQARRAEKKASSEIAHG